MQEHSDGENVAAVQSLIRRLKDQQREEVEFRAKGGEHSGSNWSYQSGDYSVPIFEMERAGSTMTLAGVESKFTREMNNAEQLCGVERSLAHMVAELLKNSKKRPIVVLDFGGGIGLSWCRLAKKFEQFVKAGEVVFCVSNMEQSFDPKLAAERRLDGYHQKNDRLLVTTVVDQGLVQYIEGELLGSDTKDAKSLRQTKISAGEATVSLLGSVDVLFARMSIIHTLIPEFHVPRVLELLSDQGIFIESSFSTDDPAVHESTKQAKLMDSTRVALMRDTYAYSMQEFDLERIPTVEIGSKAGEALWATVLRKKNTGSPRVWVE